MMKFRGETMSEGASYLPPGVHECEIFLGKEERFMGKDKKTGEPKEFHKVGIGFRDAIGRIVFNDYFLNPEYLWVLEQLFMIIGIEKEDVDLSDLVGHFVVVRVKQENYDKNDGSQGLKSVVESISPYKKSGIAPEDNKESVEPGKNDPF